MNERKRRRSSSTVSTPRGRGASTAPPSSNVYDEAMKYVSRYVSAMVVVHLILVAFFMASLDKRNKNYMVSSLKSLKDSVDRQYEWFAERLEEEEEENEIIPNRNHKNNKHGNWEHRDFEDYDDDADDINNDNARKKWSMSSVERYLTLFCMYALHAASGVISTIQLAVMPVGVMNGVLDHGIYSKTEELASTSLISILTMFVTIPITIFQLLTAPMAHLLETAFRTFVIFGNSDAVIALSRLCANVIVLLALRFVGRPIYGMLQSILPHPLTCMCPCIPWKVIHLCCCCCCCPDDGCYDDQQIVDDKDDSSTEDDTALPSATPTVEQSPPARKPSPVILGIPSRGVPIDYYLRRDHYLRR